jgi:signal peptidase I
MQDGHLIIDGQAYFEPYTYGTDSMPLEETANNLQISYPYTVPEGCIWVMGDNREESLDSRYFGAVPNNAVIARMMLRIWPFENIGPV